MHESKKRFRLGVWGRQSGKSTYGNNALLDRAWRYEQSIHWFLASTHANARIQYMRAYRAINNSNANINDSLTELRLDLQSLSNIFYKSGKVLEDLRSETLKSTVVDEVRQQHKDLWPMVLRPMLATTRGEGDFISTPNGYDQFFDLYNFAKENPDEWDVFHFPSTINPLFTAEEYESARRTMSDKQFRQEILAEFLDMTAGKAYWAFGEDNVSSVPPWNHNPETKINTHLPVVLALDFNLNPMAWTLGQTNGMKWHWFKELYIENSNTQEASSVLCELLDGYRSKGMLSRDPQLTVVGDAAGKAGQRAAAGQSDYDILLGMLRAKGFSFENRTPDANPLVRDRINAVNAKCRSADGTVSLTVDPIGCPKLMRDMQRVVWKEGTNNLDKTKDSTLTHCSDGIGYPIHALTPIQEIKEVGELVVIQW